MRTATIKRNTKETKIKIKIVIDGNGNYAIKTPVKFFDHMLEAFSKHGVFDICIEETGDVKVDQHHTIEDCGLVLGQAFKQALGDKKGINRAGYFVYPMDEALAVVAVDISGRPYLQYDVSFKRRFCGDFDTDLLEDFFQAFALGLGSNVVVRMPYGRSDHHKIESIFKALGKAMMIACSINHRIADKLQTTKGIIDNLEKI